MQSKKNLSLTLFITFSVFLISTQCVAKHSADSFEYITEQKMHEKFQSNCSSNRNSAVNQALDQCLNQGYLLQSQCIKTFLKNQLGESWDVFVETSGSQSFVSNWFYDDCSLTFTEYGPVKNSYVIWKASASSNHNKQKNLVTDDACSQSRSNAVNSALNYCQYHSQGQSAICVRNNLRIKLGQNWNAIVVGPGSHFSARYDTFDGCDFTFKDVGHYKMTYIIWKAE